MSWVRQRPARIVKFRPPLHCCCSVIGSQIGHLAREGRDHSKGAKECCEKEDFGGVALRGPALGVVEMERASINHSYARRPN